MRGRDIVVVGASAGGFQALRELARTLPADLPAALLVAVHLGPDTPGILPQLLAQEGPLPAHHAVDGEPIRHGRIYVAPPDHHLIVDGERLAVTRGPRENGFRPAVDPLFRTAARQYGERVVGVVLSGGMSDGTYGLMVIKREGGIAIVQHLDEATVPSMPLSAMQNVEIDHVLPVAEIGPLLARLARTPVAKKKAMRARPPIDAAESGTHALHGNNLPGKPSVFTCPECGGTLFEVSDGELLRFRCHTGHALTAESLVSGQSNGIENALWTALRALEESAALRRRLAERAAEGGLVMIARGYATDAADAERRAAVVREVLTGQSTAPVAAENEIETAPARSHRRPRRARG